MVIKKLAPGVPYLASGIGLWVFHNAWIAILSYHFGIIAVVLLSVKRVPLKQMFHTNSYWIPAAAGIIGAGAGPLMYIFWPLLVAPVDLNAYLQDIGLTAGSWPIFIAYYILINPWMEEYYWRGFLGSKSRGIILNDILFSGYHLIVLAGKVEILWLGIIFLVLAFGAWLWRQFNRRSNGLLASTVSHILADITIILTIYFLSAA